MTTLGKILVVVVFVLSLIGGALTIMVFAVRTNWEASYNRVARYYEVSKSNAETYAAELNDIKNNSDAEIKRLSEELARVNKQNGDLAQANKTLDEQLKAEQTKVRLAEANATNLSDELGRAREQVKIALEDSALKDKRIVQIETTNRDLRDQSIRFSIAARSANDHAQKLLQQLEDSYRELERIKTGSATQIGSRTVGVKPPPEDVSGIVLETDAKTDLVTISIGSDAGILRGQTLDIFRKTPEPKYLGKLTILNVNPHQAVGRPTSTSARASLIQRGDTVGIVGRN
ncbi:MAG: hypothetical protein AB7K24_11960 [Gemmataceae bacterium]